jgi:transcriptional regulator with XRE-family HTH domain
MIDDRNGNDIQCVLAANLRRMRIARHLSLSELARATSMSKATLSGIENGRANPTVETLAGLTGALRISVGELLEEPPLGEIRIIRSTQGEPVQRDGMPRRPLDAISSGGSVEVAELILAAHQNYEVGAQASGARAHLYVLAGRLIAGPAERCTELATGDYATFPADVPQVYEVARHPARVLLLTELPN